MKKFKTLKEMREYNAKKSLAAYHKRKQDPDKQRAYLEYRRAYDKRRYNKMVEELRALDAHN